MLFRLALLLLYNKTVSVSETPPGSRTVLGFITDSPAMGIRLGREKGRNRDLCVATMEKRKITPSNRVMNMIFSLRLVKRRLMKLP